MTLLILISTVVISTFLYRYPRGGGLGEGKTTEGRLLWAFPTAIGLSLSAGSYWPLLAGLTLWAGIAPSWGELFPTDPSGGNKNKLNWRGTLVLNPIMGEVYFWCYKHWGKLPRIPFFAPTAGYTEIAELICGFITATMYATLVYTLILYL